MMISSACMICFIIGALMVLFIQQLYWLDIERTRQRRASRKARISRMREPVFSASDHRKLALHQFGSICRELMKDGIDKLELRQQGNLILQELAA